MQLILIITIYHLHGTESGDKVNKLFFVVHNHHKTSARISWLKCPEGSYTTDPSQMRQITSDYYETLLKARSFFENDLFKRGVIWSSIHNRVSVQLSGCFLQRLSSQKVLKAAKALVKDVCPRLDGLGVQWYIQYWDLIGDQSLSTNFRFENYATRME